MKHVARSGGRSAAAGPLPAAVLGALEAAGGKVRCGARVAAILCEGERVAGVELADGSVIEAPIVVVGLRSPQPRSSAGCATRRRRPRRSSSAGGRRPATTATSRKVDAVIADPAHATRQVDPTARRPPRLRPARRHRRSCRRPLDDMDGGPPADGRRARWPSGRCSSPTSRRCSTRRCLGGSPGGTCSASRCSTRPTRSQGGWAASDEPAALARGLRRAGRSPGSSTASDRWRAMTPERLRARVLPAPGLRHQLRRRPARRAARPGPPELTRYETPVSGLYLTGAATFPGAGVWGASGRNAARVILAR